MFIVNKGVARLERTDTSGNKVARLLSNGDSFGEEILTGLAERYAYTVVAIRKKVILFMLEEEDFKNLFVHMPDVKSQVAQNASAMLGKVALGASAMLDDM